MYNKSNSYDNKTNSTETQYFTNWFLSRQIIKFTVGNNYYIFYNPYYLNL